MKNKKNSSVQPNPLNPTHTTAQAPGVPLDKDQKINKNEKKLKYIWTQKKIADYPGNNILYNFFFKIVTNPSPPSTRPSSSSSYVQLARKIDWLVTSLLSSSAMCQE